MKLLNYMRTIKVFAVFFCFLIFLCYLFTWSFFFHFLIRVSICVCVYHCLVEFVDIISSLLVLIVRCLPLDSLQQTHTKNSTSTENPKIRNIYIYFFNNVCLFKKKFRFLHGVSCRISLSSFFYFWNGFNSNKSTFNFRIIQQHQVRIE